MVLPAEFHHQLWQQRFEGELWPSHHPPRDVGADRVLLRAAKRPRTHGFDGPGRRPTCQLTIGGAPLGSVGDPSASCTARAGGTLGAVLLFNGTGKDLRSKCTDPCSLVLTVTTSPPGAEPSLGWAVITWNYPITFATAMTVKG